MKRNIKTAPLENNDTGTELEEEPEPGTQKSPKAKSPKPKHKTKKHKRKAPAAVTQEENIDPGSNPPLPDDKSPENPPEPPPPTRTHHKSKKHKTKRKAPPLQPQPVGEENNDPESNPPLPADEIPANQPNPPDGRKHKRKKGKPKRNIPPEPAAATQEENIDPESNPPIPAEEIPAKEPNPPPRKHHRRKKVKNSAETIPIATDDPPPSSDLNADSAGKDESKLKPAEAKVSPVPDNQKGPKKAKLEYLPPPMLPGQVYSDSGRMRWDHNVDFLLSLIGFAVDATNMSGFPVQCYMFGGVSFMIPYAIILIFCVIPIMYMEVIIGQFVQQGQISFWKLCPLFKGVGWCTIVVMYFVSFFYHVQLSWLLIYLYESVGFEEIRWLTCNNEWNWPSAHGEKCISVMEEREDSENQTVYSQEADSARQFFRRNILKLEDKHHTKYDMDNLGYPDPALSFALLVMTFILYFSLVFGIKVSGKVVWFTASVPYIVIALLLFRGMSLPGSARGLETFIAPNFDVLVKPDVWIHAANQVFFNAGAGLGAHLTFASFNKFKHPLLRDTIVTMVVNTVTSILCGMILFSHVGNAAYATRQNISAIAAGGAGQTLVFEIFPTAVGRLPGSKFFCFIFFLMIFMIAMDTSLGAFQAMTVAISDEFSYYFARHRSLRPIFLLGVCSVSYLISLICVTNGGIYVHAVFESAAGGVSLLVSVFLFSIGISYVFGLKELCDACEAMTDRRPGIFFNLCWKFITPGILLLIITVTVLGAFGGAPKFENEPVPLIGYLAALFIHFTPFLAVPAMGIYILMQARGVPLRTKFKIAITPLHEQEEVRVTGITRRTTMKHLFYFEIVHPNRRTILNGQARVAPAPESEVEPKPEKLDPIHP